MIFSVPFLKHIESIFIVKVAFLKLLISLGFAHCARQKTKGIYSFKFKIQFEN